MQLKPVSLLNTGAREESLGCLINPDQKNNVKHLKVASWVDVCQSIAFYACKFSSIVYLNRIAIFSSFVNWAKVVRLTIALSRNQQVRLFPA